MITQDKYLIELIDAKKKMKTRKRNFQQLMLENSSEVLHRPSSSRPILSDISVNSERLFSLPEASAAPQDSVTLPGVKRCPCPNCSSPAKQLHLRRAECTKCRFDFCRHCFRNYHDGACKTKEELWGECDVGSGPSKIYIAGVKSKAVKRRLKRL